MNREFKNTAGIDIITKVKKLLEENPTYRIVADVGMSTFSGYGELVAYELDHGLKIIELFFEQA